MNNLRKAALKWIKDWEVPEDQREECIRDFEAGYREAERLFNEMRPDVTSDSPPPVNEKLILESKIPGIAADFLSQHANESAPEGEEK